MTFDIEDILTREQKEDVIRARIAATAPHLLGEIASLRYDRRYSWDFEVVRGPAGKARVTFSTPIASEKFPLVIERAALAVRDIRFGGTTARAIRGRVEE